MKIFDDSYKFNLLDENMYQSKPVDVDEEELSERNMHAQDMMQEQKVMLDDYSEEEEEDISKFNS